MRIAVAMCVLRCIYINIYTHKQTYIYIYIYIYILYIYIYYIYIYIYSAQRHADCCCDVRAAVHIH